MLAENAGMLFNYISITFIKETFDDLRWTASLQAFPTHKHAH